MVLHSSYQTKQLPGLHWPYKAGSLQLSDSEHFNQPLYIEMDVVKDILEISDIVMYYNVSGLIITRDDVCEINV